MGVGREGCRKTFAPWRFGYLHKLVSLAANWQDSPPSPLRPSFVPIFVVLEGGAGGGRPAFDAWTTYSKCPRAWLRRSQCNMNINTFCAKKKKVLKKWSWRWDQGRWKAGRNKQCEGEKKGQRLFCFFLPSHSPNPPSPYSTGKSRNKKKGMKKTLTQLNGKLLPKPPSLRAPQQTYWSCHAAVWPILFLNYLQYCATWQILNKTIKYIDNSGFAYGRSAAGEDGAEAG